MTELVFGADTLCWHRRIEGGEIDVETVLGEAADAGAEFVQLNLHHVRDRDVDALAPLAKQAAGLGLELYASGDFVGAARRGERPEAGVERVAGWIERAVALGSPLVRLASGFYRAELAGRPEVIEAERRFVVEVLGGALPLAESAGVDLALENHSDFTVAEYHSIIAEVDSPRVGVFLDLINPISAFEDPVAVAEQLAPIALAGHVKDYALQSHYVPDRYHRTGFSVAWCYPGDGVADLAGLLSTLRERTRGPRYHCSIEGLGGSERDDQRERIAASLGLLRSLDVTVST